MDEKILVIENDPKVVIFIQDQLEYLGYQVMVARNGAQGLDAVARQKPNLIVLDVMMPRMSGYEVCERLKSSPETNNIPILMLTAKGQLEDKIRGFDKGTDDYLTKPYAKAELEVRVKALLRRSSLHQSASRTTQEQAIAEIRRLFALCKDSAQSAYEKGLALEDLSAVLLASCFEVEKRVRSDTGEVDLWLERNSAAPFWEDYGGVAVVECKNRSKDYPVTSAEVSVMIDKCVRHDAKLGLFVSLGPFTRDALKNIQAQNVKRQDNPLIVPIRQKDVRELVRSDVAIEEWLRNLVRSARQDRKGFYSYGYSRRSKTTSY